MKKLIRTVPLLFFQDDGNDEFGLAHDNTINHGFNAFYDGIGIFHDVFEHWFEDKHKYFRSDAAFNIGGEMTAMGSAYYFHSQLGLGNRNRGSQHFADSIRITTQSMITECFMNDGYGEFGDALISHVPYQPPVDDIELELQIKKLYKNVQAASLDECNKNEQCAAFKDSVTFGKIANLHRYGYRMAEHFVNDNKDNYLTLFNFIFNWNSFCRLNDAEKIANVHKGVTFRLYKEHGRISWTARFERKPEFTREDRDYIRIPLITNETEIGNYHE